MECAQRRQKWTRCAVIGVPFHWMSKNEDRNLIGFLKVEVCMR
jgi:hypothetical protein